VTRVDPVDLAVFANRFAAIAEEMGRTLQRTALSPNIKERRDASCAIFTAAAEPIAQAAHIPVHLGALPLSTRAAIEAFDPEPGDVVILNDPFAGGTHLPDITLVAPVFLGQQDAPGFWVANRAHHADVGGKTPGSMPLSVHIDEEGLRIPPTLLRRGGQLRTTVVEQLKGAARTPLEREGDLMAQLTAIHVGQARLQALCQAQGTERVQHLAEALLQTGERHARAVIASLPSGRYRFRDLLDDDGAGTRDIPIEVELHLPGDGRMIVDFRGSSPEVRGCLNAVEAITLSACAYVVLCLAGHDLPPSGGALRVLEVLAPEGSVVRAGPPAAVAGGNVETSQRIVDVLLGALAQALPDRMPAASCGSMNNLTIGGRDPRDGRPFAYYETTAGGAGGGPGWTGRSGVHTHMTNTGNTPIESLEHAYPLLVRSYRLRPGSGGGGLHRGGEGVERSLELRCPATVTLLGERRRHAPWGLAGGDPGQPGENLLIRGGESLPLAGKVSFDGRSGDVVVQRTPGGGGWGRLASEPTEA
jgi:N-methylhydantoinase B